MAHPTCSDCGKKLQATKSGIKDRCTTCGNIHAHKRDIARLRKKRGKMRVSDGMIGYARYFYEYNIGPWNGDEERTLPAYQLGGHKRRGME